jgi:copper ion binding protein
MTQQITLKVGGMGCSGCVATVEKALRGVSGVAAVKVDLKGGKATVEYDSSKAGEKDLAAAVTKAGYKVG